MTSVSEYSSDAALPDQQRGRLRSRADVHQWSRAVPGLYVVQRQRSDVAIGKKESILGAARSRGNTNVSDLNACFRHTPISFGG